MTRSPKHKSNSKKAKIPLPKAVLSIFLSVCIVSGSSLLGLLVYKHMREKQRGDPYYNIVAVVQTSPDAEGIKTAYLAELLGLSVDRPDNLYSFNAKEARQALLEAPFIRDAKVRKILPGTIHIDYTLRKPIAYYRDYSNTAVDAEGVLFPFKPFYTPKRLPEIITGQELDGEGHKHIWGRKVTNKWMELAFALVNLSSTYCDDKTVLCRVDVSKAYFPREGSREVVLMLEDRIIRVSEGQTVLCIQPRILRLCPDNYRQQLANYISLRTYLREKERSIPITGKVGVVQEKPSIIDLRLSDLAFIAK